MLHDRQPDGKSRHGSSRRGPAAGRGLSKASHRYRQPFVSASHSCPISRGLQLSKPQILGRTQTQIPCKSWSHTKLRQRLPCSQGVIFPDLERRPSRQPLKPPGILDIATGLRPSPRNRADSPATKLTTPFAQAQPTQRLSPGQPGTQLSAIPEHQASGMPAQSSRLLPSPGRLRADSGMQGSQQLTSHQAPRALGMEQSVDVLAGSHTAFPALDAGEQHQSILRRTECKCLVKPCNCSSTFTCRLALTAPTRASTCSQ